MIVLGIDPDTYNTGIALVDTSSRKVLHVAVASVDSKRVVEKRVVEMIGAIYRRLDIMFGEDRIYGHASAAVVEGQRKYPKDNVRPQDLVHLAQVAGIAAALCVDHLHPLPFGSTMMPEPRLWKGSVPKPIHQARILKQVGLTDDLRGVRGAESLTKTQKGHVIDAIGLALWGGSRAAAIRKAA
jgi:hypothetical protein